MSAGETALAGYRWKNRLLLVFAPDADSALCRRQQEMLLVVEHGLNERDIAPTDEAFAKLPEGTVESLLKPENQDQLKAILTYHVVPGKTMSSDLAGKQVEVESVEGSAIPIDATGDNVMVGDATVTQADVEADNGVIHVIDEVIQPQS